MTVALLHSSQVKLTNPLPNTLHYKIHKKQVVQQNSPVQKVIRTKQTHNQSLKADQNMASIGKSIGAASTHTKSQTIASQLVPSTAAGSSSLLDQNLPNQKSITSNNMNQRIWSLEKSGAFALFFLLISVSSPVSCFPLGGEAELTSIPQRQVPPISSSSSSASSSLVDVGSDGTSLRNVNYMAKPQSQLFHPSLFKSPPTAEEYGDEWPQQRFDRQQEFGVEANLDPANSPQQHQHLQKLQVSAISSLTFLSHSWLGLASSLKDRDYVHATLLSVIRRCIEGWKKVLSWLRTILYSVNCSENQGEQTAYISFCNLNSFPTFSQQPK